MFDANKILKSLTTGDSLGMAAKTGAGGALAGGLISALGGKKPKKIARTALTSGGLAAIAGLAYQAWRNHEQGKAPSSAPPAPPEAELRQAGFLGDAGGAAGGKAPSAADPALLILTSMIYAARADGEVDAEEHRLIQRGIAEGDFDAEEKAFLMDAFGQPVDLNALAGKVGSPQAAMDVYTAAYAVVDPPSLPERAHLDMLRARLGLSEGVTQAIEAQVDTAAPQLTAG